MDTMRTQAHEYECVCVCVCVCVRDCKHASARTYGLNETSAPMNNRGREGLGGWQRESAEEHGKKEDVLGF